MPSSTKQYKDIPFLLSEVTDVLIALPLKAQSVDVCTAIMNEYIKLLDSPYSLLILFVTKAQHS